MYKVGLEQQLARNEEIRKSRQMMSENERSLNNPIIESFRNHDGHTSPLLELSASPKIRDFNRNLRNDPMLHQKLILQDLNYFKDRLPSENEVAPDLRLSTSTTHAASPGPVASRNGNPYPYPTPTPAPALGAGAGAGPPTRGTLDQSTTSIEPMELPEGQTRRHYKPQNYYCNAGRPFYHPAFRQNLGAPFLQPNTTDPRNFATLPQESGLSPAVLNAKKEDTAFGYAQPVLDSHYYKQRLLTKQSHVF